MAAPHRLDRLPLSGLLVLLGLLAIAGAATVGLRAQVRPTPPAAQQVPVPPAKTPPLDEVLREGFRLFDGLDYEAARKQFELALTRARAENDVRTEAEAHRGIGLVCYEAAQYPQARAELDQALALFQKLSDRLGIARVHRHLGSVAYMTSDPKAARSLWEQALAEFEALGERREQANVLRNLTFSTGQSDDERIGILRRGLAIATDLGDRLLQARFLHNWGDFDFNRGRYAAAQEKLQQAIQLFERTDARDELARALTSLGRVQRAHGNFDRALDCYRRALGIQEAVGDRQGVIQSVDAIGFILGQLGQRAEAVAHYERALALARETGSRRQVVYEMGNLAGAYVDVGKSAQAIPLLEEVIREEKITITLARRYLQLSEARCNLGSFGGALEASDKALAVARNENNPEVSLLTWFQRAKVNRRLGRPAEAMTDAGEALRIVEELRTRVVPSDFMKRGFGDLYGSVFGLSIELLYETGQPAQALEAAEQARGRAFLDLLAAREVQPKAADRAEVNALRQVEQDLKARGVDPAERPKPPAGELAKRGTESELGALWRRWQDANPELRSLVSAAPPSLAEITAQTSRLGSTLLTYWVGEETTLIWVVTPKGSVQSASIAIASDRVTKLVEQTFSGSDASPQGAPSSSRAPRTRGGDLLLVDDAQKQAWRELYTLLIRPIRHLLPPAGHLLTIEPHGPLLRLSFAALLDERGQYLIERHPLHYTPAAAVLQFTAKKERPFPARDARYLFVADPAGLPVEKKPLPPLPGARREVAAVAKLFPSDASTVLTGAQATEEQVRGMASGKHLIHLATHGIVRDDQPLDSFLALGASGTSDGRLSSQKVYGLDLQADLVVLSACRSGLGKISGDGIVGLARAFFYAGAASVVATVWDVADEPSFRLVPEFYRALLRSHDKAGALRAAQLQLLRDLRAGRIKIDTPGGPLVLPEHPMFWAAYVLMGEP